ncbi:MAG: PglZ domain-containing protein [Chthoniobacteraceae bacterium]|nr:PglZ domain-containing protein [Chthoniobacteraceae bacterium]
MSIEKFIAEQIFWPRAKESRILVVYDPERIYGTIIKGMAGEDCRVIMAEGAWADLRQAVLDLLTNLAHRPMLCGIVWTPSPPPTLPLAIGSAQLQNDPLAVAAVLGERSVFPAGADDSLLAISLKAFPDFQVRIHEFFRDGRRPGFALINQLQQGQRWPELQAALGGTARDALSSREILEKILIDEELTKSLPDQGPWMDELRVILEGAMGLTVLPSMRRAQEFRSLLWRTLLFSEFVFDASADLPEALRRIPLAAPTARDLINDLCEKIRGHAECREIYIRFANEVEDQLRLVSLVAGMASLGRRDTFAFEERLFLDRFCQAVERQAWPEAEVMVTTRLKSMWILQPEGAGRRAEWQVAKAALELLQATQEFVDPPRQLAALAEAYQRRYYLLDRSHRLLEQAVGQRTEEHEALDNLLHLARSRYHDCASRLHAAHLRAIELEGWPATGASLENGRIFDQVVQPLLQQGKKVAYLLIDSLRYELAVDLKDALLRNYQVDLQLSYAQLPTYTEVGMASLMPNAKAKLNLRVKEVGGKRKLVTHLGDKVVTDPSTRFSYLKENLGDLCVHEVIAKLRQPGKLALDSRVRLFVVRQSDIDEASHASESQAMQQIPGMMKDISQALSKLTKMGFDSAVIVTDHGFMLKPVHSAGDACEKPAGTWLINKARCLLGTGGSSTDPANWVIDRERLGIQGEFTQYATPRAFLAYDGTTGYFHEGLSPQENFLPCMIVTLQQTPGACSLAPEVFLSYRGRSEITTVRPALTLEWKREDLLSASEVSLLIQAVDEKGEEIATIALDENVDPTTQRVTLPPGKTTRFTLIMKEKFEGAFTVKVLDPGTLAEYHHLKLQTNFTY